LNETSPFKQLIVAPFDLEVRQHETPSAYIHSVIMISSLEKSTNIKRMHEEGQAGQPLSI